mmetsp:Transcript_9609/g.27745  ORF Transcript_9609/g.27745 Transcript_9609/m.27745 type:complete len:119 (-) Transcript_9609:275-631(-)
MEVPSSAAATKSTAPCTPTGLLTPTHSRAQDDRTAAAAAAAQAACQQAGGDDGLVDDDVIMVGERRELEAAVRRLVPVVVWGIWREAAYRCWWAMVCACAGWLAALLLLPIRFRAHIR